MEKLDAEQNEFGWTAHPAFERPRACCLAFVLLLAAAATVFVSFGASWAAFSLAVLVFALNRFFFRSRFVVDARGITARYPLRRQSFAWIEVRRFVIDQHGGYLSTRLRPSRLDGHSGMHVLFGRDRASAIDQIRRNLRTSHALESTTPVDSAAAVGAAPCRI